MSDTIKSSVNEDNVEPPIRYEVESAPSLSRWRRPSLTGDRVNDRFLTPGTSFAPKDKTTAAQVLFREGFTFEQVAEMFGYVKEGDRP